ncbi:histone-fold-containing protein [Thozetella sp. PMI_491]|nr:histone-fold-containing protein [Thozetella sp. PMI_491]
MATAKHVARKSVGGKGPASKGHASKGPAGKKPTSKKPAGKKPAGKKPASKGPTTGKGPARKKPVSTGPRSAKSTTKTAITVGGNRKIGKKRRYKPGTKALKEIRCYQKSTKLLIPKAAFSRLVREIVHDKACQPFRMQASALGALQEAAEQYLTRFFEMSYLATIHGGRITMMVKDFHLVSRILIQGASINPHLLPNYDKYMVNGRVTDYFKKNPVTVPVAPTASAAPVTQGVPASPDRVVRASSDMEFT